MLSNRTASSRKIRLQKPPIVEETKMSQPTTTTVVESPEPKPRIVIEEEQIVEEPIDAPIEVKLDLKPVAPKKPNFGSKPSFGLKKPNFGLGAKKLSI